MNALDPHAAQLSDCLERIAAGESLDSVLNDVSEPETAYLIRLAADTARVAPIEAPPAFKARLQVQLQSELDARHVSNRPHIGFLRVWLGRAAAVALALALAVSSAVVASADDVPGESLYGLKRAVETARLAMAFDPAQKARLRIDLVGVRLSEIESMVDRGMTLDPGVIEELLAAQRAAEEEAETSGEDDLVELAREQATEHGLSLESMADEVDAETRELVRGAASAMGGDSDQPRPLAAPAPAASPTSTEPPTVAPTATVASTVPLPTESEPEDVLPPTAAPTEVATQVPAEPTRRPPTSPPTTDEPPATRTSEPTADDPTVLPATDVPTEEPSPLPTLKREDERMQTQTAEARSSPTPTPRRRPQHGNTEPSPPPPTSPPTAEPGPSGDGPPVPRPTARPRDRAEVPGATRVARPRRLMHPLPTLPPLEPRPSRS